MEGGENLNEDRMKENLDMARYNNAKEDVYRMNMEESYSFIESKYRVNLDDISSDEEDDTLPKYVFFHKRQQNYKSHFGHHYYS